MNEHHHFHNPKIDYAILGAQANGGAGGLLGLAQYRDPSATAHGGRIALDPDASAWLLGLTAVDQTNEMARFPDVTLITCGRGPAACLPHMPSSLNHRIGPKTIAVG